MKYLVTGGSGTFGRAFLAHILENGAERAAALARHEKEISEAKAALGHHDGFRHFIGDVRDPDRLLMAMRNVDTVIHAAALKRIEVCEDDPVEAVKTNVVGTINVIHAALQTEVRKVVLLSTDKAVDPVNLYGATKLCAERLVIAANNLAGGRCTFAVARYGNIWGSRGSVVHQWRAQIAKGEQIRLTRPDATRYFMLPEEAVKLVVDLLDTMKGGEIKVPKLRAYKLVDLALALGQAKFDVVGLPAWEKLHETMDGKTDSSHADRMNIPELRQAIEELPRE